MTALDPARGRTNGVAAGNAAPPKYAADSSVDWPARIGVMGRLGRVCDDDVVGV